MSGLPGPLPHTRAPRQDTSLSSALTAAESSVGSCKTGNWKATTIYPALIEAKKLNSLNLKSMAASVERIKGDCSSFHRDRFILMRSINSALKPQEDMMSFGKRVKKLVGLKAPISFISLVLINPWLAVIRLIWTRSTTRHFLPLFDLSWSIGTWLITKVLITDTVAV